MNKLPGYWHSGLICAGVLTGWLAGPAARGAETPPAIPATVPGAIQAWNCERWQTVLVGDFGGINTEMKALRPIKLLAPRNGVASGYVVVTRDGGSITNLKAAAGDLAQCGGGKGRIAAAQTRVRFADQARYGQSWASANRFDRLLEAAPAELAPVDPVKVSRKWNSLEQWYLPKHSNTVVTVPVWVTVRVPAHAAPGEYAGTLSIEADGLASRTVTVPLVLHVSDWQAPDPKDFRVRTMGWMNPEALAKHYDVPLWSERHFELMGRSMEQMLELGSRQIQITVTRGYPIQDNADTMIKWIKQADGTYKYDFAVFDRYCDLAARKIGKPFPIRINIWHGPGDRPKGDHPQRPVLVVDPATGATNELPICAALGSEEDVKFWKPVFDELRVRLEKRGWFDVTGCNWCNYSGLMVSPKLVDMVKGFWPGRGWTDVDHGRMRTMPTSPPGAGVPIFVQSTVWNEGDLNAYLGWTAGPYPRKYAGWFKPETSFCTHARNQYNESSPLWRLRTMHEEGILKGNDGLDPVGADMFPIKDARGRFVAGTWRWAAQGPGHATQAMLGAGDEGPVGSERFEAMREGIQLCEAMVFIQKALEAKALTGELESKANRVLDDRARAFVGSLRVIDPTAKHKAWRNDFEEYARDSFQRDGELYATAGEVAKAVDGRQDRPRP